MLKSIIRILLFSLCIFALIGCAVIAPPGRNQNLQATDVASEIDSTTEATAPVMPTAEGTLPKVLENYQDNLISEYVPLLDGFENATRYAINLVIEDEINPIFRPRENYLYQP